MAFRGQSNIVWTCGEYNPFHKLACNLGMYETILTGMQQECNQSGSNELKDIVC